MKRNYFACGTEAHILVSFMIISTIYKDEPNVLLLHKNDRTDKYLENLKKNNLWNEIIIINSFENDLEKNDYFEFLINDIKNYHYFSWGFPEFNAIFVKCDINHIPIILTDEGLLTYSPMRRLGGWISQNSDNLELVKDLDFQKISEIWVFEPDLFIENKQWFIRKLSFTNFLSELKENFELKEKFNNIFFQNNGSLTLIDVVYFRQYYDYLGIIPPEVDAWVDETIIECFKKNNLLVKNHPAHTNLLYEKNDVHFQENHPWELYLIRHKVDFDNAPIPNYFISSSSSSMFKTLMFEISGTYIFLYKLLENYSTWKDDTLDEIIAKCKLKYPSSKIMVPSSWDEFRDQLNQINKSGEIKIFLDSIPDFKREKQQLNNFYFLFFRKNKLLCKALNNNSLEMNKLVAQYKNAKDFIDHEISVLNEKHFFDLKNKDEIIQNLNNEILNICSELKKQKQERYIWENENGNLRNEIIKIQSELEKQKEIISLDDEENKKIKEKLKTTQSELENMISYLSQREIILKDLNTKLIEIYNSTAWKLIKKMWLIRLWLVPKGSRIEEFGYTLINFFKKKSEYVKEVRPTNNDNENITTESEKLTSCHGIEQINWIAIKNQDTHIPANDYLGFRDSWRKIALQKFIFWAGKQFPQNISITHIFLLPLFSTGGAEVVAINFMKVITDNNKRAGILVIITDQNLMESVYEIPDNIIFLNLDQFLENNDRNIKKIFLFDLIKTIKPFVIHNINSSVMWELIIEKGNELQKISKLYSSIFCLQFDNFGNRIGYAEYYLQKTIQYLNGLFTDNFHFINDVISIYGLENERGKFNTFYTPHQPLKSTNLSFIHERINGLGERIRKNNALNCLWAGRLDAQKKWDLFISIVERSKNNNFFMYGKSVMDKEQTIPEYPNLNYHEGFVTREELFLSRVYDVFIFTSEWEGLPTILLDAGLFGIPIIAPAVGGVGELINVETGFLLAGNASVDDYIETLDLIKKNPNEVVKRCKNLLQLILEQHSWDNFNNDILALKNYIE